MRHKTAVVFAQSYCCVIIDGTGGCCWLWKSQPVPHVVARFATIASNGEAETLGSACAECSRKQINGQIRCFGGFEEWEDMKSRSIQNRHSFILEVACFAHDEDLRLHIILHSTVPLSPGPYGPYGEHLLALPKRIHCHDLGVGPWKHWKCC